MAIPIDKSRRAFAVILEEPRMAFFDHLADEGESPLPEQLLEKPIAFSIWVMNDVVTEGAWPVIGRVAIPPRLQEPQWFFKKDPISGELSRTLTGAEEVSATLEECRALECAAVWEREHVLDRLRDHFSGTPNKWVDSMRPD